MTFYLVQFVRLTRFSRDQDRSDNDENVTQYVQSVEDVRVPVQSFVNERVQVIRRRANGVLNLYRVFKATNFADRRHVTVSYPYLSTYPDQFINVTLVHRFSVKFSNSNIV